MVVTGRYILDAEGTFLHTSAYKTALNYAFARPPNLPTQLELVLVGRFYAYVQSHNCLLDVAVWLAPHP